MCQIIAVAYGGPDSRRASSELCTSTGPITVIFFNFARNDVTANANLYCISFSWFLRADYVTFSLFWLK